MLAAALAAAPGTQHMSLSAGIAQEPVSMTPRLTAETFCFAPAQTLASPSTVRWSSAVDSTIKLACTGVAHKARAVLSSLSGQRHVAAGAAFGGQRASVECGTSAPSDQHLFQPDHIVTQMSELLMQRANNDSWSPSIMAMQHAAKVP